MRNLLHQKNGKSISYKLISLFYFIFFFHILGHRPLFNPRKSLTVLKKCFICPLKATFKFQRLPEIVYKETLRNVYLSFDEKVTLDLKYETC